MLCRMAKLNKGTGPKHAMKLSAFGLVIAVRPLVVGYDNAMASWPQDV